MRATCGICQANYDPEISSHQPGKDCTAGLLEIIGSQGRAITEAIAAIDQLVDITQKFHQWVAVSFKIFRMRINFLEHPGTSPSLLSQLRKLEEREMGMRPSEPSAGGVDL